MARRSMLLSAVVMACVCGVAAPASAESKGAEAFGELVRKVRTGTLRERLEALARIAQTREPRQIREWNIVELLRELSEGDNPRIARRAVKALGDLVMGADRSIKEEVRKPLQEILDKSANAPLVRVEAARQLGRILSGGEKFADATAISALVKAAKGSKNAPEVAAAALVALGNIGDAKGVEPIRSGLSSNDSIIKEAALEAVGKFLTGKNADKMANDASFGGLLMRLLSDQSLSSDAKERVLESVGRAVKAGVSRSSAESAILRILEKEEKPSTVIAALKAIGFAGTSKCANALIKTYTRFITKETDQTTVGNDVRAQVCASAGELFDSWGQQRSLGTTKQAAVLLSELLTTAMIKDDSDLVRKEAIVALGNLYNKRYDRRKPVAALIALLGASQSDDLKEMVAESIEMLTGRSFGADVDRWERWYGANERKLSPSMR